VANVQELLALALSKVGYAYSQVSPGRWTGANHAFDCSGFMYFLPETLGVRPPDWQPQSHLQALYMRDHSLLLNPHDFHDGWGLVGDPNAARSIPGALVTEGPSHSYVGGAGIPGHIAMSLGNGHTVEAMGTAWGTCIGNFDGRGWSNAGLMPGIDYAGAVTPPHPPPVQGQQLEGENMATVIPARAAVVNGRAPCFVLDVQSDNIFAYNGAKLSWRGAPTPAPAKLGAFLVYKIPTKGPHFGLTEPADRHTLLPSNVLCVVASDGGCAFADMLYP
jgi:hypothetical protein